MILRKIVLILDMGGFALCWCHRTRVVQLPLITSDRQLVADKILKLCVLEEFAAAASSPANCWLVIRLSRPGKLVVILQTEGDELGLADPADNNAFLEFDDLALCISAAIGASGHDFIEFEVADLADIP